jgi:hypothetical protein
MTVQQYRAGADSKLYAELATKGNRMDTKVPGSPLYLIVFWRYPF